MRVLGSYYAAKLADAGVDVPYPRARDYLGELLQQEVDGEAGESSGHARGGQEAKPGCYWRVGRQ